MHAAEIRQWCWGDHITFESTQTNGGVQFGLISDAQLCPHPQKIIDRFEPEFEKLLLLTLMLPWN